MKLLRIVSGGQTGADRAALDAAIEADFPHGGWCPKGRRAEDGIISPDYELQETAHGRYAGRTEANARDSDATVVFTRGKPAGGSAATVKFAAKHGKPCLHVDLDSTVGEEAAKEIVAFVNENLGDDNCILNIAGSRESCAPGIYDEVKSIISALLSSTS